MTKPIATPGEPEAVRERFSMLPESLIVRCRDAECLRLFAWLDLKTSGPTGRAEGGYNKIARLLRVDPRVVKLHADHLHRDGLVTREQVGRGKALLKVAHNPARRLVAKGVELPERPVRYHRPSNVATLLERLGAEPVLHEMQHSLPHEMQHSPDDCAAPDASLPRSLQVWDRSPGCAAHGIVECLDCPSERNIDNDSRAPACSAEAATECRGDAQDLTVPDLVELFGPGTEIVEEYRTVGAL